MSISSVVNHFLSKGLECSIVNCFESNAKFIGTGRGNALGVSCNAKTFVFRLKDSDILIVTREDMRISNKKFEDCFKIGPKELSNKEVIEITGHPVDGLSPFGLKNSLKVYIDVSLKGNIYINLCAGLKNFVVIVTPKEIVDLTCGEWVDICKEKEYSHPLRKS